MYKIKQKSRGKKSTSRKLLVTSIIPIVVIVAVVVYFLFIHNTKSVQPNTKVNTSGAKINLDPATPTEKSEAENNKDKILSGQESNKENQNSNNSSSKKSVKPIITNVAIDNVSAYVNSIFEDGGICTATFIKGSTILTKTSSGFQNVSYTQCAPFDLDSGYLSKGTWSVSVKYTSNTSEGTSDNKSLEVK